jgi:hypothetical protein
MKMLFIQLTNFPFFFRLNLEAGILNLELAGIYQRAGYNLRTRKKTKNNYARIIKQ